jgi:AraC family transcriptional regulator, regulatory protein of adaptative response / DNA-3-methyladenine glycosylase II
MNLSWQACNRARLSRDARFDGKFFIGVVTTGIYCRPICPSRTAKDANVRYFPSAAAAEEAGFRPCLRCRPECSPGTPAWLGTPSTVARALRLIDENGLANGGVESLAGRLGVGSRHLRRLFLQHLGATPSAVAQTRRLHFAKKLIDETSLPMIQVALAAGFGSVRRFNAAFRKFYHRSPTQLRCLLPRRSASLENEYLFRLHFRPPYHWRGMLHFLARRATPGVEAVDDRCYWRSISLDRHNGYFAVTCDSQANALLVRVQIGHPGLLFSIIGRIRSMFDLNADWPVIAKSLKSDPLLAPAVEAYPGLRVPGCWDGFELAVRTVLERHVNLEAAAELADRVVKSFGTPLSAAAGKLTHLFPSPEVLAHAQLDQLGLPACAADCIRSLAQAVWAAEIRFDGLVDCDALVSRLRRIRGITSSMAQYVAMRALREPDAFPCDDPQLLRNAAGLAGRAEAWRPWGAYAAMYLWSYADAYVAEKTAAANIESPSLDSVPAGFLDARHC